MPSKPPVLAACPVHVCASISWTTDAICRQLARTFHLCGGNLVGTHLCDGNSCKYVIHGKHSIYNLSEVTGIFVDYEWRAQTTYWQTTSLLWASSPLCRVHCHFHPWPSSAAGYGKSHSSSRGCTASQPMSLFGHRIPWLVRCWHMHV